MTLDLKCVPFMFRILSKVTERFTTVFENFAIFIRHLLSFWSYCKTVCGVKQNTDSKLRY